MRIPKTIRFLLYLCSSSIIYFSCVQESKENTSLEVPDFYTQPIINDSLVDIGKSLFAEHCGSCHVLVLHSTKAPDIADVLYDHEPADLYSYLLGSRHKKLMPNKSDYKDTCRVPAAIGADEARALTEYFKQYQNYLHEMNSRFR